MNVKLTAPRTALPFVAFAPSLRSFRRPLLWALLLFPLPGMAQILDISGGIQTYVSLTNTTVNMTGRSELHITAASNPIPGCVINLNSSDAWFFLENIQPSNVIANYLSQIQVSGAAASSNSNVRAVEYGMGTVVIPHSSDYSPLQIFAAGQFTGASMQLGLYTYYNDTNLGALYKAFSSFKLKRGYMATFAQQPDGTGISRVYIAQDGDIEISALPVSLDQAIGFVRVFPWRWTGKKGWSGGAQPLVNPLWNYDWDNVATSSPNIEYVPMRHNANWNAYANINNKQDSTHVLAFNEPNSASQANMTVAEAIAQWPNLMASGLRLGSPAPTDGGLAWLYDFIDQADALTYRVDYVAVHFYKGGWSATQLYNWLSAIHDRTHRPIWLTEFNNGANWTCCTPTLESNAQTIGQFMDVMNRASFVERYAIYNWVGPTRAMVASDGTLTPAGVVYRDKVVPKGYIQDLPEGNAADAKYLFQGNAYDSTGNGNDGILVGAPSFANAPFGQAIQLDAVNDYVQLPANLGHSSDFTFAAWVNWSGGSTWQRIFDLGDGASRYLFLTPRSGGNTLRFAITTNGSSAEQRLESSPLVPGTSTHVAVTIRGTIAKLFVNGALVATNSNMTVSPITVASKYNYLGKSQYAADPLFTGQMGQVLFAGYALSDAQVAGMAGIAQVEEPTFSPAGGNYVTSQSVTIASPTAGATIRYTVDGSTPTSTIGTVYTGRVSISATTTLKAVAYKSGMNDSTVSSPRYSSSSTPPPINVSNFGFEAPVTSTYIYNPVGFSWTFSGGTGSGSGVSANGSAFTSGKPPASEGVQVAFVQSSGTISQALSGFVVGSTYTITFAAAQRANKSGGQAGQTWDVTVDGTTIASFAPDQTATNYVDYTASFTATAGTHTVAFAGTNLNGGDNTIFIDNVRITSLSPSSSSSGRAGTAEAHAHSAYRPR